MTSRHNVWSFAGIGLLFGLVVALLAGPQLRAADCRDSFASRLAVDPAQSTLGYYDVNAALYAANRNKVSPGLQLQLDRFTQLLRSGARILEVGAGHGRDAAYFKALGFEMELTEPSVGLAEIAARRAGQRVYLQRAQDLNYAAEFDAVWAMTSLIHVPPEEMPGVLQNLRQAVKPGGLIFISMLAGGHGAPNMPETISDGRYFNRMTERAMRRIIRRVGGLGIIEGISGFQADDFFTGTALARPSATNPGFFNLYIVRIP